MESERIRAAILRGGTSKGVFFRAGDLPADPAVRDAVVLSVFGSPDPRQIDGLGGADPLTSKVAIVGPSARTDADVDYTVGYVSLDRACVDYEGNCGNISQAVGPFAIDEGLVPAREPVTRVRIFNTNTSKILEADVLVKDGRAVTEGEFVVHGVPGTGARITVNFVNAAGSKTGALLPTGQVVDAITLADGRTLRVSLVDAAAPAVFVKAADLGLSGRELPDDTRSNPSILSVMEEIRCRAAIMMRLAPSLDTVSPAIPKVAFVAAPQDYTTISGQTIDGRECDLLARTKALAVMHKAYAVTGGLCVSAAALIDGTVVSEVASASARSTGTVRLGHPSGVSTYAVTVQRSSAGEFQLIQSAVAGTARRIMDGHVYVPSRCFRPAGHGR